MSDIPQFRYGLLWGERRVASVANSPGPTPRSSSVFAIPLASNLLLVAAVVGTQVLQSAVLWLPPLHNIRSLETLTISEGMALAGAGLIVLAIMEFYKRARPLFTVAVAPCRGRTPVGESNA